SETSRNQCGIPAAGHSKSGGPDYPDDTKANAPPNELLSGTMEKYDKTVYWDRINVSISS
ncbi:hypothetical protein AVEN_121334-1, partial [Araneus ventricosus]